MELLVTQLQQLSKNHVTAKSFQRLQLKRGVLRWH